MRSRGTYTDVVKEPQWEVPPGDVGLNCLLAGRSNACGVWVDVNLKIAERFFSVKLCMIGFGFGM